MQTEWSPDNDDRPGEGRQEPSPWGRPTQAVVPTPAPLEEMAPGEEEIHRSAVDAVDGLLDEVELALARLDDGTYGRCDECGEPIDDDRLAELPIIRTCARCVSPIESDGGVAPAVPSTPDRSGL